MNLNHTLLSHRQDSELVSLFLFSNGSSSPFRAQAPYSVPQSFFRDGRNPWMNDQPVASPPPKHRTTQTQNIRTHRHPCLEWNSNPRSQRLSCIYLELRITDFLLRPSSIWTSDWG
jgi:hypothetical protein